MLRKDRQSYAQLLVKALGGKCARCGSIEELEIDHVVALKDGGADDPSNLQVLCYRCHREKHKGSARSRRQEILDLMTEPRSANEIARKLDIHQRTAQMALMDLAERGKIEYKRFGRYHIFWVRLGGGAPSQGDPLDEKRALKKLEGLPTA